MAVGQVVAIVLAAASTLTLLITFYLLRMSYQKKMEEAGRVLGVGRQTVAQLEREGHLPGALGLGQPVAISPHALQVLLGLKAKGGK